MTKDSFISFFLLMAVFFLSAFPRWSPIRDGNGMGLGRSPHPNPPQLFKSIPIPIQKKKKKKEEKKKVGMIMGWIQNGSAAWTHIN